MDSIEQIEKLKQLLDSGLIDEGEFHKLKKEILDSIEKADSKKLIIEKIDESEQPKSKLKKSPKTLRNLILGVLAVGIITVLVYFFYFDKEGTLVPYLKLNGKYVFVDSVTMEIRIDKDFNKAELFIDGIALVQKDSKYYFIKKDGGG